jgi:phospholipid/cholesterol/gamma-HCH transport system substrate-binding protein
MNQTGMKFRLGLFVLGTAILLGTLIVLFGEAPTWFSRPISYTIKFREAPGVEAGTPVRKSGVKIGEVTGFDLDPDSGEVQVFIGVQRRYQLRKGDQAFLARGLVLGDTSINFVPEGPDRAPADAGHQFAGQAPGDLRQALGKATDLLPAVQETMEEVRKLARAMNETMPEARRTLTEVQVAAHNLGKVGESADNLIRGNQDKITKAIDQFATTVGRAADLLNDDNQRHIAATIRNLRSSSDKLDTVLRDAQSLMKNAEGTLKNVDTVAKNSDVLITETRQAVKNVSQRVDSVGQGAEDLIKDGRATVKRVNESLTRSDELIADLRKVTKELSERTPAILKNIEEATGRFNQITADAAEFVKTLASGDGTLRRLAVDPTLYHNVNELATSLNRSAARFDCILRDLQLFADKVARHPELLGVSGAVTPSSGIKR